MQQVSRRWWLNQWLKASFGAMGVTVAVDVAAAANATAEVANKIADTSEVTSAADTAAMALDMTSTADTVDLPPSSGMILSRLSLHPYPQEPIEGPLLILRDGSRISAAVSLPTLDFSSSQRLDVAGWSHETTGIPTSMVAGVLCRLPTDPWQCDQLYDAILSESRYAFEDTLRLTNGDYLKGVRLTYHAADEPIDTEEPPSIKPDSATMRSSMGLPELPTGLPTGFTGAFWSISVPYEPSTESATAMSAIEAESETETRSGTEAKTRTEVETEQSEDVPQEQSVSPEQSRTTEKYRVWNIPATRVAAAAWGRKWTPLPPTIASRSEANRMAHSEVPCLANSEVPHNPHNTDFSVSVNGLGLRDGTLLSSVQLRSPENGANEYRMAWATGGELRVTSEEIWFALPSQPNRVYLSDGSPKYYVQAGRGESSGWGRDRDLDGRMLRESGQRVLRGVAQAVHSQLSFDLVRLVAPIRKQTVRKGNIGLSGTVEPPIDRIGLTTDSPPPTAGITGRFVARLAVSRNETESVNVSTVSGISGVHPSREKTKSSGVANTSGDSSDIWSTVLAEVCGEIRGKIFVDGQKVWESPPLRNVIESQSVEIPLHQATRLDLVIDAPERWTAFGLRGVMWFDAAIFLENPRNS